MYYYLYIIIYSNILIHVISVEWIKHYVEYSPQGQETFSRKMEKSHEVFLKQGHNLVVSQLHHHRKI